MSQAAGPAMLMLETLGAPLLSDRDAEPKTRLRSLLAEDIIEYEFVHCPQSVVATEQQTSSWLHQD